MVLLEHEAYVVAQEMGVVFPEVDAVQHNVSAVRLVEFVQQVDYGTLSGSGKAHERRDLAAIDIHVDIPERLGAVGVGEVHVADAEVALDLFRTVASALLDFLIGVKDVKEAFGID